MAKSIMIQGTMSNAGKSLLTAGLAAFLNRTNQGPPFKSQNMALNSVYQPKKALKWDSPRLFMLKPAALNPAS
jgi:adenosylcobyric acid synthase